MKLRFQVDQAESLRRGIDCPKSIVTIEVDPSKLTQIDRDLIADNLNGIDVCVRCGEKDGSRVLAKTPSYESLIEALNEMKKKSV